MNRPFLLPCVAPEQQSLCEACQISVWPKNSAEQPKLGASNLVSFPRNSTWMFRACPLSIVPSFSPAAPVS